MNRISNAVDNFLAGYACSQAILTAYSELVDLDRATAMRITSGFAGGMGMAKTCGAVTSAYMVLGMKFSAQNCETSVGRKKVYAAVSEFSEKFEEINGTLDCKGLLGCDISSAEGMLVAKQQHLFTTMCPQFVKNSAELLEIILEKSYSQV